GTFPGYTLGASTASKLSGQENFSGRMQTMAQYGTLKDYRFTNDAEDIRGAHLYGLKDEKLGKIDDVIFDHSTGDIRYVVVDTGGWLSSKKFVVPAEHLRASAEHKDDFAVDLTKAQIEAFPPYDEKHLESDEQWGDYDRRYRAQWKADPVMHRVGTNRDITPTTYQMEGNRSSEQASGASASAANRNAAMENIDPSNAPIEDTGAFETGGFAASTDTVYIDSNANGIGGRWDTFQDRLRERRKEVIGARSTAGETDTYRKAG
ncbi:MAG: PRC-barrel domain-containing protein, partial [Candidatus Sulfotelmatobacter sp.]